MDGGGFEDFASREQPALLRLGVLLAGDRCHAEDLVQTALLKTYRHWGRITRTGDRRGGVIDGVAIVPSPERAATIETRAADGTVLATTRPRTSADLGD